ncbi:hypothetical protein L484_001888 [Morus notabilis]|uniref:Uncharacterized protein n=1 Tax=Morus notabilis TaxID=981085 RepID=W9RVM7_9ROSA|nr:hypothetical protein L484_001888 [Morus notabilis]
MWPQQHKEHRWSRPLHKEKIKKKLRLAAGFIAAGTVDDWSQPSDRASDGRAAVYHRGCTQWWSGGRHIWSGSRHTIATLGFQAALGYGPEHPKKIRAHLGPVTKEANTCHIGLVLK